MLPEAELAMRLSSPHAVKLYEVGALPDGRPFLVMERLVGNDVARSMVERGPASIMGACEIVLQACHALAEAHRLGVVHRDVKPANLFLTTRRDGTPLVKVLDFGIASFINPEAPVAAVAADPSAAKEWHVAGSPGYAAPEQIASQRSIDARADIWALGIVLYELVLGRRPFDGATLIDTLIAAGTEPVPSMGDVPPAFEAIVRRCLEKDREQRFRDVVELAEALAPLAPPELADYPELVRIAYGGEVISAVATQRMEVEELPSSSKIASRRSSPESTPASRIASSRVPRDASMKASQRGGPSAQSTPVVAGAAIAAASCLALLALIWHARETPAPVRRAAAPAAPGSSMLLPPLSRSPGSPPAGSATLSGGPGGPGGQPESREVP
jgi:serine/threonine-protein kinase